MVVPAATLIAITPIVASIAEKLLNKAIDRYSKGSSRKKRQKLQPQDASTALALAQNQSALQQLTDAQGKLAKAQQRANDLKRQELALQAQIEGTRLAQQQEIAQAQLELRREEMALKAQLTAIMVSTQRELQQKREKAQKEQIQAAWDLRHLPTIFSRQELERLAGDRPLFVCAKMQVTEGCPKYFRTELAGELESQMRIFASQAFSQDIQFYSRFFADDNVFDTNAAQLKAIIPHIPCFMAYSKMTQQRVYLHYQMWGMASADVLDGCFDLELPWNQLASQVRQQAGADLSDSDLYGVICDWVIAMQKVVACYLLDLYGVLDGPSPYGELRLGGAYWGLPMEVVGEYVTPLLEQLQAMQQERITLFEEELQRQREAAKEKAAKEKAAKEKAAKEQAAKEKAAEERKKEAIRQLTDEKKRMEAENQRIRQAEQSRLQKIDAVPLISEKGVSYIRLRDLLKARRWREADQETQKLMEKVMGTCEWSKIYDKKLLLKFPRADLKTIDQLWVQASQGRYGFSVQKEIYGKCGKREKFGEVVGWKNGHSQEWLSYDELTLDGSGVLGHLPAIWHLRRSRYRLFSRL
ncbi:MAG: GUN4 domain-containing protein [Prochlorothrix sp.]|nr:GUN4 domain-containing protein [Prochlorothrix sp.]